MRSLLDFDDNYAGSRHMSCLGTTIMSCGHRPSLWGGGVLSWLIGMGSIVLKLGISRVRNECCDYLDMEKAGS